MIKIAVVVIQSKYAFVKSKVFACWYLPKWFNLSYTCPALTANIGNV